MTTSATTSTTHLLPCRRSNIGIITLNNPAALNALTLPMIHSINSILPQWQKDESIKATIFKGTPRKNNKPVFCAGGDVKSIYFAGISEDQGKHGYGESGLLTADFFRHEYQTNYYIATQRESLPQISMWDGVVMGGGVGLSIHGKYRVCTENTIFAMPETAIGLFPDVGGTHWLSKLNGGIGNYIALAGHKLKSNDLIYTGIGTHYVKSEKLDELENELVKREDADSVLNDFNDDLSIDECFFSSHRKEIGAAFDNKECVEDIFLALESLETDFGRNTLETLKKMSPLSLKVTFESLKRGKLLDVDECLKMEYRMCQQFMKTGKSDFYEGIRAMLVDKDHDPKWSPSVLDAVTDEIIQDFFESLGENELQLSKVTADSKLLDENSKL